MADNDNKPLKDYTAPSTRGLRSSIIRPPIDANNFELKPTLIHMGQQNQYGGAPMEDSNLHLEVSLENFITLKHNGASDAAPILILTMGLGKSLVPFTSNGQHLHMGRMRTMVP